MAAVMFDTQKFVKRLQAAKIPPEQAEAQSEAMSEVLASAFASHAKAMEEIGARTAKELDSKTEHKIELLRKDLSAVEERLNSKMSSLEIGLRKDMEALGNKLIIRLTLAMLGVLGVVGTIAGFALRAMMLK